jgi:flagellar protein FlaG
MLIQSATSNLVSAAPPSSHDHVGASAVVVSALNTGATAFEHLQPTVNTQTAHPSDTHLSSDAQLPSDAQLKSALEKLNQAMRQNNTNLEFSIDKDSKQMLIKVVDSSTGETIRQFPSKEAIVISEAIDQFQTGLLIRQKA